MQNVFSSVKHKREEKKSRSEKKVSTKQLIEESGDNDEAINNDGGNNSTEDLSEPMMEWRLEALMIILGMLFILLLELISIFF